MNNYQIFDFEEKEIRTVLINDVPYFVGRDITEVLGYSNSRDALSRHVDEPDKGVVKLDTLGGMQDQTVINESGLYSLIFKSKLPNAKKFTRWVTAEVLPAIRKTGSYSVPTNPMEALRLMFEANKQTKKEIDDVSERVLTLEEDTLLSSSEYNYIGKLLNRQVMEFVSVKGLEENNDAKKLLFKDINTGIHAITGIRIRAQLRNRHFSDVVNYIRDWIPSQSTLLLIEKIANEKGV